MKKLYTTALVFFTAHFTFANPVINSMANNGNWKNASTWSLDRLPMNGDTVVISAGKTVIIDDIENLDNQFLYIKIYGTLKFSNGKLWINNNSSIAIFNGGSITSTGSPSETLKIGGIDKFSGSIDGTLSTASFANKTTGTSPLGFNSGITILLPVKFISFNLAHQNNDVLIQWATAEEISSSYFDVQRSENGKDWSTIAHLTAASNTLSSHSYSYTDKDITSKIVYYRICQVDIDGRFTITAVRTIKNENRDAEIKVNASSSNSIYVHFSEQVKENVVVRLISTTGQIVSQKTFDESVGQVVVAAQNTIKGIYIITATDGQNLKFSKQILL